jgi:hypothetical protein
LTLLKKEKTVGQLSGQPPPGISPLSLFFTRAALFPFYPLFLCSLSVPLLFPFPLFPLSIIPPPPLRRARYSEDGDILSLCLFPSPVLYSRSFIPFLFSLSLFFTRAALFHFTLFHLSISPPPRPLFGGWEYP